VLLWTPTIFFFKFLSYFQSIEAEYQDLRIKFNAQNEEINSLRFSNGQKDKVLLDLKSCWQQVVYAMTTEREELLGQNTKIQDEMNKLKLEQSEFKQQFFVCQDELEKALDLASQFKQKVDQDEQLKQDLLNQLLSERAAKTRENAQITAITEENRQLHGKIDELTRTFSSLGIKATEAIEAKEDYEKRMAFERGQFDQIKSDLEGQIKANEANLHAFYLTQMESIVSEKVDSLQNYVKEWEAKLLAEKIEAMNSLKQVHRLQIDALKKQFGQLEAQINASQAVNLASRREADVLKEQFQQQKFKTDSRFTTTSSSSEDDTGLISQRSLPTALNNKGHLKATSTAAKSSAKMRPSVLLMNNLRLQDKEANNAVQPRRPRSSSGTLVFSSE
jgi:chromosome segregation ATPase